MMLLSTNQLCPEWILRSSLWAYLIRLKVSFVQYKQTARRDIKSNRGRASDADCRMYRLVHNFMPVLPQLARRILPGHKYYTNMVLFITAKKLLWVYFMSVPQIIQRVQSAD
jgi:hypothetical protein